MGRIQPTRGRVRGSAIPKLRVYYKPSLRRVVFRPSNVWRGSPNVLEINEPLKELKDSDNHPSRLCAGKEPGKRKPWVEYIYCLGEEFDKIIQPLPLKRLDLKYRELVERKLVETKERPREGETAI